MSDPSYSLQKAIVAQLRAEVINDVWDTVPERDPFPRITIGPGQVLSDNSDCRRGSEVYIQIDVWSRARGFGEAKNIASQVRDALDDVDLTLDGHSLDYLAFESAQFLRDPDGSTSHVAMTFRALTAPDDEPYVPGGYDLLTLGDDALTLGDDILVLSA